MVRSGPVIYGYLLDAICHDHSNCVMKDNSQARIMLKSRKKANSICCTDFL